MSELVYTLLEFCHVAKIDEQLVMEFVEHGILEPELGQDQWLFRSDALSRCLRAERMRHDFAARSPWRCAGVTADRKKSEIKAPN
jgi:hypothetical protein